MKRKNKNTKSSIDRFTEQVMSDFENAQQRKPDRTNLDRDLPENLREPIPIPREEFQAYKVSPGSTDETDRGEDLINERAPVTQSSERDTQVPPELVQERAFRLYEQRGASQGQDLADWFEAERQLKREIVKPRG